MTRQFYLWHRRLAICLIVPMLVFSLSGLLHPLMRLTRPDVAQMFYPTPAWPADLQIHQYRGQHDRLQDTASPPFRLGGCAI